MGEEIKHKKPVSCFNRFFKIKDAADFLGTTTTTLRRWDRLGKLKSHRNPVNNYRLYDMTDLEEIRQKIISSGEE